MNSLELIDSEFESSLYIGIVLSGILYGVMAMIYFTTLYFLSRCKNMGRQWRYFYATYSSLLFVLGTILYAIASLQGMLMWIIHRDQVEPFEYYETDPLSLTLERLCFAIPVIILSMDGMLLTYRCYIIFDSRLSIALVPALCNVVLLALGFLQLVPPRDYLQQGAPVVLWLTTIFLALPANALATIMISTRIIIVSRRVNRYVRQNWQRQFTGVVAILIESAAPGTVIWIAFMILTMIWFTTTNVQANSWVYIPAIGYVWFALTSMTPHLIMVRIAMGIAWDKNTSQKLSEIALDTVCIEENDADGEDRRANMVQHNSVLG